MRVIPWGTDQILARPGQLETQQVHQNELLSKKLYGNKIYRDRFNAQIAAHVKNIWNEEAIKAEIDQQASKISPFITDQNGFKYANKLLKERVQMRRQEMSKFVTEDPKWAVD